MLNYFEERQSFTQWWVYLVPALMIGITIYVTVEQLIYGRPVGNNPIENSFVWILWVFSLALLWLLYSIRLTTVINRKGIHVRLRPFVNKLIAWDEVGELFVRQYRPLAEYGGYGLRFGKNGTAYNIKGNMGLQLVLKSGKRLLIGTQKAKELEALVERIKDEHTRENYI